jgi:hypothetical protein
MFAVPANGMDLYSFNSDSTGYIGWTVSVVGKVGDNHELVGIVQGGSQSAAGFYNIGWDSIVLSGLEDNLYYGHTVAGYAAGYPHACTFTQNYYAGQFVYAGWTVGRSLPPGAVQIDLHKAVE